MSSRFRRIFIMVVIAAAIASPRSTWAQQGQSQGQGQDSGQGSGDTQSQGRRDPFVRRDGARKARPRQRMEMLARKLNLTDAQRQQFQQIGQQLWQQSMSIRNDSSLTEDQKKEKLQVLRKQSHMQMLSVLTPEQKEQLKQMRDQQRKDQEQNKAPGDQASSGKAKPASATDEDDLFAGMTGDDDDGPPSGHANID